ncbi:MAG: hypothetical protein HY748_08300 [Elusimicrobia bacterium]|nr:hypothetical protein [Elusimicrobiota bacterium]
MPDDLDRYASYVRRHLPEGTFSIEICGYRDDSRASDIDVLLVVEDYSLLKERAWRAPAILNPEALSSRFAHGPFVCLPGLRAEIAVFTTLAPEPLAPAAAQAQPSSSPGSRDPYCVIALQSACLTHLKTAIPDARAGRHLNLLSRSLAHSLNDIDTVLNHFQASDAALRATRDRLLAMRSRLMGGAGTVQDWDILRKEAVAARDEAAGLLGAVIVNLLKEGILGSSLAPASRAPEQWLAALQDAFFAHGLGCIPATSHPGIILKPSEGENIRRLFTLVNDLLAGYLANDLLPLGAEFPFIVPNMAARIGPKIWIRRLLKRALRAWGRLR